MKFSFNFDFHKNIKLQTHSFLLLFVYKKPQTLKKRKIVTKSFYYKILPKIKSHKELHRYILLHSSLSQYHVFKGHADILFEIFTKS